MWEQESEEADPLLHVVAFPERESVEVLQGHPEHAVELVLRQVPLWETQVRNCLVLTHESVILYFHLKKKRQLVNLEFSFVAEVNNNSIYSVFVLYGRNDFFF